MKPRLTLDPLVIPSPARAGPPLPPPPSPPPAQTPFPFRAALEVTSWAAAGLKLVAALTISAVVAYTTLRWEAASTQARLTALEKHAEAAVTRAEYSAYWHSFDRRFDQLQLDLREVRDAQRELMLKVR